MFPQTPHTKRSRYPANRLFCSRIPIGYRKRVF
nr:MAG TPA: hypothetical protein [Caudoviricetes sp.]